MRSDIANQVPVTSSLKDRPVLFTIDQLPLCSADNYRNAVHADNSVDSSRDGSTTTGRYLPLIVESDSLSSVVVQDPSESTTSLLSATEGERKMFCSSALSVVSTSCANFALAPLSGAALSPLTVSVSSAPFGRMIPVVFANCGPLTVATPVSLATSGSRTTKFPNIAPKTVSCTASQNTLSEQLAPMNSGVTSSSSSADSRLACRNGVVYVLQAGDILKEK